MKGPSPQPPPAAAESRAIESNDLPAGQLAQMPRGEQPGRHRDRRGDGRDSLKAQRRSSATG